MPDTIFNLPPVAFRKPGVARVNPGEICNDEGDIEGAPDANGRVIIKAGLLWVTPAQADRAARFGWQRYGEWPAEATLVQVGR